jgi:hypothetical protein
MELGNSYMEFTEAFRLSPDGLLDALKSANPRTKRTFPGIHVITKAGKIKRKYFKRGGP